MDYLHKIDEIIKVLEENKEDMVANKISSLKRNAPVSSELLMAVTYELILITSNQQNIKNLIGDKVIELQDYCYSIGLRVL